MSEIWIYEKKEKHQTMIKVKYYLLFFILLILTMIGVNTDNTISILDDYNTQISEMNGSHITKDQGEK